MTSPRLTCVPVLHAVVAAVLVVASPWSQQASADEPGFFSPAPDAVGIEPAHDALRLRPILTQSFLQLSDAPLELLPSKQAAGPELLPPPAPQPNADGVPAMTGIAPSKPSISPQVPGLATDERPEPLTLQDVLRSVLLSYPLLQAVERERGIAAGRLTTAMGAFDTKVNMAGQSLAPGTYENYRSDFGVSQQFMTGGISAFGGFRTGFGDFPTYNLGQKTADAGEWRGGLNIPLVRDREIDRARGDVESVGLRLARNTLADQASRIV